MFIILSLTNFNHLQKCCQIDLIMCEIHCVKLFFTSSIAQTFDFLTFYLNNSVRHMTISFKNFTWKQSGFYYLFFSFFSLFNSYFDTYFQDTFLPHIHKYLFSHSSNLWKSFLPCVFLHLFAKKLPHMLLVRHSGPRRHRAELWNLWCASLQWKIKISTFTIQKR